MKPQILEGSRAIALTVRNIGPGVVSAYPITPQTHIVEDLAKFKADGEADYEYFTAESEFAAASIAEGASATGVRAYSATSSQGLLLMTEVLFNIAGMRLPVVMTCANRAISAPISIWNDHQDAMTVRDAGLLMFFAENHQEAVSQHILAYKIAEKLQLGAIVNVDGFILTHSYEEVVVPDREEIKKFLPDYKPKSGTYLDPENPKTLGAFATPADYLEIRQKLQEDLVSSLDIIKAEYEKYNKAFKTAAKKNPNAQIDNGLLEYYGPKQAKIILIAMGSVVGTIKEAADAENKKGGSLFGSGGKIGVLKIKTYRPFPADEIIKTVKAAGADKVAVVEKAVSLGLGGPLGTEVKAALFGQKLRVQDFVVGLGGRDITVEMIKKIIASAKAGKEDFSFIGK